MTGAASPVSHGLVYGDLIHGCGHLLVTLETEVRQILPQVDTADDAVGQVARLAVIFFDRGMNNTLMEFHRHFLVAVHAPLPRRLLRHLR